MFDRNLKEIAVSYRLYSLYVRPAEIVDMHDVAQVLADVTGQEMDKLYARLNTTENIVQIAEHLEQPQVDLIKNTGMRGLYVKPVEERFYPEHESAASLVGFTGKGIGLAGVEGVFDTLLQDGEFRTDAVSGIDFHGDQVLGRAKVDIVLTIDLGLQKRLEKQLQSYLEAKQAARGMAILMDPKSGAVLAWVSLPSFNPNYYWQVPELDINNEFEDQLDPELLRNLRVRLAALQKKGESGDFPLPETVATVDYGLDAVEIDRLGVLPGHDGPDCFLPSCRTAAEGKDTAPHKPGEAGYSPIDWTAAAASMLNGGWKVEPYVLQGIFDHDRNLMYGRTAGDFRERAFSPAMGIKIRQDLLSFAGGTANRSGAMVLEDGVKRVRVDNGKSRYVMQDALLGAVPAKNPEMLLFMLAKRDELYPSPRKKTAPNIAMRNFGEELLGSLYSAMQKEGKSPQYLASAVPEEPDQPNYNQFLISSRIDFQERGVSGPGRVAVMPQLVGLSLRKGLQQLNEYDLQVKVQGSGQIVSQVPRPGQPLQGIGECVLTLGSEI